MVIPCNCFSYSCVSKKSSKPPKLRSPWIFISIAVAVFSAVEGQSTNEACLTVGEYKMDYTDCSYYFRCEVSYLWIRQACAPGTVFDQSTNVCDYPPGSCALVTSPSPTTVTTPSVTSAPTPSATSAQTSIPTSTPTASVTSAPSSTSPPRALEYRYLIPTVLVDQSGQSQQTILVTSTSFTGLQLRIRVASPNGSMTSDSVFTLSAPLSFHFPSFNQTLVNDSGISDVIVDIRSSDPINVIFFQNSGNTSHSLATILPTSSADVKFVITSFSPPTIDVTAYKAYIAVVAVENGTEVFLEFPCGRLPGITLTINRVKLTSPRQGRAVLDSLKTLLLETSSDVTGTLIESTRPVLVYTGTVQVKDAWTVPAQAWTFEQSLPAAVSGTIHVTFPSLDGSREVYRVLAIYDATTVQVPDMLQKDPSSGTSFLASVGDAAEISLPSRDSFYVIRSDKPVQITKLIGHQSFNDTCTVDLLPSLAWATNYSWSLPSYLASVPGFSVKVFVLMNTSSKADLRLDGQALGAVTWSSVLTGALSMALLAGYFDIDTGYHWIDLNQSTGAFAAYLYGRGHTTRICTALGPAATQVSDGSGITWTRGGLQEIKYGFDEITTATYDATSPSEDTSVSGGVTTAASQVADTTRVRWPENSTSCPPCLMPWFSGNLSQEQAVAVLGAIRSFLYVDPKSTSAHRRSLESAPDYRPVSNGIGVSGIVFCTCAILCIVISDLFTVGAWLWSKIRKCFR